MSELYMGEIWSFFVAYGIVFNIVPAIILAVLATKAKQNATLWFFVGLATGIWGLFVGAIILNSKQFLKNAFEVDEFSELKEKLNLKKYENRHAKEKGNNVQFDADTNELPSEEIGRVVLIIVAIAAILFALHSYGVKLL